MRTKY